MLILDATTRSLEIDLNAVVAANQLPFVASYVDMAKGTVEVIAASSNTGASNSTTAVTLVAAPTSANFTRHLKYLSIRNADTAAVLLWIQVNDNATLREIWKGTLAIGDSLIYTDALGFNVLDTNGRIKVGAGVSGPGATTDNALVRWDGTGGTNTQNSAVIVDDSNNVTGVVALTVTGTVTLSGTAANIATGANFISYAGTDAGFSLDSGNNATFSAAGTFTGALTVTSAANQGNVVIDGVATGSPFLSFRQVTIEKGYIQYANATSTLDFFNASNSLKLSTTGATLSGTLTVSGAQLAVGIIPNAWTTYKAFSVGGVGANIYGTSGDDLSVGSNVYNSSGFKRANATTAVSNLVLYNGIFQFQTAADGAADSAITFLDQVRITHTASADRYITLTGSAGGNPTIGVSAGSLAITPAVVMAAGLTVTGLAGTGTRTVVVDANGVMSAP